MKLPVKLLTAVAAIALLAVGVVSVQNAGDVAEAAVTGSVHITNKWSTLTTQSPAPTGRTFVGSGSTLYSSLERRDGTTNNPLNTIMANSDRLIISVADADANSETDAEHFFTMTTQVTGGNNSQNVFISAANTPIIGSVQVWHTDDPNNSDPGTATLTNVTSQLGVVVQQAGDGDSQNGVVSLTSGSGGVTPDDGGVPGAYFLVYQTSEVNTLTVSVRSTAETTPVEIVLTETSRSSGVFEGIVRMIDFGGQFAEDVIDGQVALNPGDPSTTVGPYTVFSGRDVFTNPSTCSAGTPANCNEAFVRGLDGNTITVSYVDTTPTSGTQSTVTRTARVDVSAPTAVVSAPAHDAAVQVRNPSFSGTATDASSGLALGDNFLFIFDNRDDADNTAPVLSDNVAGGDNVGSIAGPAVSDGLVGGGGGTLTVGGAVGTAQPIATTPTLTGSPNPGALNVSWTFTPTWSIPLGNGLAELPVDNFVDYQLVVSDRAGNVGFSDSDSSTTGPGSGDDGSGPHVVKIDQRPPVIDEARTGMVWNASTSVVDSNNRRSIQVLFDDRVSNIDNTDFQVEISGVGNVVPTSASVVTSTNTDVRRSVFLTLDADLPSDATPVVRLIGQIADLASNTTSTGSANALDHLAPVVTVELSAGTGTGSGASGPSGLTRQSIVVTVTADEDASTPVIQVYDEDAVQEGSNLTAVPQGGNVWRATYNGGAFPDGSKSVLVEVSDISPQANQRTVGTDDPDTGTRVFTLDATAPVLSVDGTNPAAGTTVTTSQRKPFVVIGFMDDHTVSVDVATVGGSNVLPDLATTDNKRFFFVPAEDLAIGELTVEGRATDLAGNQNALQSYTLSVAERNAFSLQLFAGWNAKSFPSDPLDPDINSVFTNTGVDQVVSYNAMDVASPWRIATRDSVSGAWTSSTATPLNNVRAGRGYWIHTNNFAPQEVDLVGEAAPGSGSPPPVASIPTARGWNFIGIVSQSRLQTEGASGTTLRRLDASGAEVNVSVDGYFNTVNQGRVYRYDSSTLTFRELSGTDAVNVGEALWVFISPQSDGSFPAIVP